ncbi:MAG TPA: type II toxin-antitoxin system HicA family toxin [Candidatus Nitrosotalea sp.]|nr:type II toxin-antitoxin system HicA family toxin [Candidatus Nitrosotalea sp.]
MGTRLPAVDGGDVLRALRRAGFVVDRISGSHHVMRHADGRKTSIPVHSGKSLRRGLLAAILKDVRMSAEEFRELL